MNIYTFSMLVIFLSGVSMTIFILSRKRRATSVWTFSLVLFSSAIWSGSFVLLYGYTYTESQALLYSRTGHMGSLFIPIFFLHFTLVFLEKLKKKKIILIAGYLLGLIFLLFIPTKLFIRGMVLKFNTFSPLPGFLYPLFISLFIFLVLYAAIQYILALKEASGRKKSQIKYMILAIIFGFGGGSLAFLRPYINIPPIYGFLVPFYFVMVGYAILKHRLMEITVIIRKGIIYSLLILFVTGFYALSIFLGQQIFQEILELNPLTVILLAGMVIAISFRPLEDLIAKTTDKIFFKARYDYQKTLSETSQAIASIINLDELLSLLFRTLITTVKVRQPRLFLLDLSSNQFIERTPKSLERKEAPALKIDSRSSLILLLKKQKTPLSLEGITYKISTALKGEVKELERVKAQLEEVETALSFPLVFKGELVGLLNLGPKLSGDDFTTTDLRLLSTLANQATIAVKNADLVETLQQSRKEFQEKANELERFYRATVGRELKMAELKKKIEELGTKTKE